MRCGRPPIRDGELRALRERTRCRVCYVGAADRMRDLVAGSREHSHRHRSAAGVESAGLERGGRVAAIARAQLTRARNKGVTIEARSLAEADAVLN